MPFVLDVRTIGQGKTHPPENLHGAVEKLGGRDADCRQARASVPGRLRSRCGQRIGFLLRGESLPGAVVERGGERLLRTSLSRLPTTGRSSLESVFMPSPICASCTLPAEVL